MEAAKGNITLTERIIEALKKAAVELEEFRLQATLGKMEARDLFENLKKNYGTKASAFKTEFSKLKTNGFREYEKLKSAVDELMLQLALGKAETRDAFEKQRKKIVAAIKNIERIIASNYGTGDIYRKFLLELKKLRIKLDIMRLRYELKKADFESRIKSKKPDFEGAAKKLKKKLDTREKEARKRWKEFSDEMHEAFDHFKKAFAAE